MAPTTSSLLPSSQSKKQQSISSFFSPKPPAISEISSHAAKARAPKTSVFSSNAGSDASRQKPSTTLSKRRIDDFHSDAENQEPDPKRSRQSGNDVLEPPTHDPSNGLKRDGQLSDAEFAEEEGSRHIQLPTRTSKYIFSKTPHPIEEHDDEYSQEQAKRKEILHKKFVQKLGRPDSISEIKSRNKAAVSDEVENGDGEDDQEEEEPAAKIARGKRSAGGARANGKLTPMELQFLEIKRKNMDTIIAYEVGYKFRFFGEDARIAARELGIFCVPGKFRFDQHPSEAHYDRFASASFPVARLHVHVKRLVSAGHKVGVVRQVETAALKKVGDNRNTPFIRQMTNVYTKGTYVDDLEGLEGSVSAPVGGGPATGFLLCLTESSGKGWGNDEKVHVGIIAVQPSTGSIIYDDFEDGFMRSEIETRLLHISPCEYLIVGELSGATEKLIRHLSGSKSNVFGDQARVERLEKPKTMAAQAYSHISNFYAEKLQSSGVSEEAQTTHMLDKVHQLNEKVTLCLSAMINHLTEYGLEHIFDLTKNFQPFSARSHMLLNGNTLSSLEIYRNQTDQAEKGSLFWTLDRTRTRFGKRLLRNWVGRPLLDKVKLEERINSIEELLDNASTRQVERLKHMLLSAKSDLEKILVRIYYKKASRPELLGFLQTLQRVANEFAHVKEPKDAGFQSTILNEAIAQLPTIGDDVIAILERINLDSAQKDDRYTFFRTEHETDDISARKLGIAAVEQELMEHRAVAGQKLGRQKLEYATVSGIEYLIEVENTKHWLQKVPASWIKISNTKKYSRFHTPEVIKMIRERDQHKELLSAACDNAYEELLVEISAKYQPFRDCIQAIATLDCLQSLAEVAAQPGYTKPKFSSNSHIRITQGRHPMVEQLLLETYVPNDIRLSSGKDADPSALLITGPNMGGKSSYVRSVALVAIMGQIGSYVPAESAELGMLDAVFTRMGAFDNIFKGESTFMVELGETSDILKQATSKSLVILDELGRGTSTHDGAAIAEAVMRELVERRVMTLFITHYQHLARLEESCHDLENVHMKFSESGKEGEEDITFLYEVGQGVAHRSYGLNVARLAQVPKSVIDVAAVKSKELELSVGSRKVHNICRLLQRTESFTDVVEDDVLERVITAIEQL